MSTKFLGHQSLVIVGLGIEHVRKNSKIIEHLSTSFILTVPVF